MKSVDSTRSPLGLVVLWLLHDEPKHVYRMQKLVESFGKDRVVNVRSRASLYQAIQRLHRAGLVEVVDTERPAGRPERVVYGITDAGRTAAQEWLRRMLRTAGDEFPEFAAAVSMLFGLTPDDARSQLEHRAADLQARLTEAEQQLGAHPGLPRLFLLEEEYRRAVLAAELSWVRGVVKDLRAGRLHWDERWLPDMAAASSPPEGEETGPSPVAPSPAPATGADESHPSR